VINKMSPTWHNRRHPS